MNRLVFGKAVVVGLMLVLVLGGCSEDPIVGTPGATTGSLSISDDQGYLYLNSDYVGKGSAIVNGLTPGSYSVRAVSPTTGETCWERTVYVYAGKTSIVKNNAYCR